MTRDDERDQPTGGARSAPADSDVAIEDLREPLEPVDGKTPAKRLIVAIAYKHGVRQSEIAEWFDIERETIYNWVTRHDKEDLASVVPDEQRPGRPEALGRTPRRVSRSAPRAAGGNRL